MRAFSLVARALGCRRIHSCSFRSVFLAAARFCSSAAHRASRPSRYAAYPPLCLCAPPTPSSSRMSGHTASMNARSCDTSSVVVSVIACRRFSNHSTPSTDRWFVGSSRMRRSGSSMSAAGRHALALSAAQLAHLPLQKLRTSELLQRGSRLRLRVPRAERVHALQRIRHRRLVHVASLSARHCEVVLAKEFQAEYRRRR